MTPATSRRLVDFDEFMIVIREDQKADLIDGVIHMASPESLEGNELVFWFARLLADFVEAKDAGSVYILRVAFRLGKHQAPEPDLAFVLKERSHLARYGFFDGRPDIAVEMVSPESVERDYEKKKQQYQAAEVPEYWIIDEERVKVTLYRLDGKTYVEVPPADGKLSSTALPGFWLRPEWLLKLPRPKKNDILALLLSP